MAGRPAGAARCKLWPVAERKVVVTLHLIVLGDSFAFTDDGGPRLPGESHLYPNVAAGGLSDRLGQPVSASVVARPGCGVRDLWRTLTKDRHVQFELLPTADAVVVAVGSFDHAPAGTPPWLSAVVPYVRPSRLRRRLRRTLHEAHPRAVAWTRGCFPATPRSEFARLYHGILLQVRALSGGAAGVALGPAGHASDHYARLNPHRARGERLQRGIAARHGFPLVASWPLVEPHLGRLNRDGIHWPVDVHAAVGAALADVLAEQLTGRAERPQLPGASGCAVVAR